MGAPSRDRDLAFADWVRRAKAVRVVEVLQRRGHYQRLKGSHLRNARSELVGPCPHCGGTDRFGVNPAKDVWNCRKCGQGGAGIALVMHCDGVDFLRAVEILTGEPPPGATSGETDAERQARRARHEAALAASAAAEAKRQAAQDRYREDERRRMWQVWRRAAPIGGSIAEHYLMLRGVRRPAGAHLRSLPDYALWNDGAVLHKGPAMAAAVLGPDGHFAALHVTWIDLDDPDGKARVADPATGELVAAKKVRGSQRGGSIFLARPEGGGAPTTLLIGEGIETVLSVRAGLIARGAPLLGEAEFRSGVSLGNMAGKAAATVPHPTETTTDTAGRVRRKMVGNAVPLVGPSEPVIAIPGTVERIILIGDGDSEPVDTGLKLRRAAARFSAAYPWVTVGLAMAPEGQDFNDLWRAMSARPEAAA